MTTIHKYPLAIDDNLIIEMPQPAEIIHVGLDPAQRPCVWAVVDPAEEMTSRTLYVVGTGHPMPAKAQTHIGSFVQGPFIWHVFTS